MTEGSILTMSGSEFCLENTFRFFYCSKQSDKGYLLVCGFKRNTLIKSCVGNAVFFIKIPVFNLWILAGQAINSSILSAFESMRKRPSIRSL